VASKCFYGQAVERFNPTRKEFLPCSRDSSRKRTPCSAGTQGKGNEPSLRSIPALLRHATTEDLEGIYHIEIACFEEHRFRRDHLDWILRNERALTLVEEGDHGRLDGAIMLLFEGQFCRVLSIATMPERRRKGLGTRMMQAAEEAARKRNCTRVRLEVSTRNYGAIEFYRGLGYRTDGVLYGYYSWGEDAYSMVRSIVEGPETSGSLA